MTTIDHAPEHHPRRTPHGHGWMVGMIGIVLSIMLLAVLPRFPTIAGSVAVLVLLHVIGFAVVIGTVHAWFSRAIGRLFRRHADPSCRSRDIDFGWSVSMDWGLWLAAVALVTIALSSTVQYPQAWPAWFVLGLQGIAFAIGGILMRQSRRTDIAVLPMVRVFSGTADRVLDAGCGAGRTTLAIAKVMNNGCITAFDRFDAFYIDGGGQDLLRRNLESAGIADRVEIVAGDLTCMPFPDDYFDTIISTNAIDHLGKGTDAGLTELHRTIKPGGRMLLVLWVPGWTTFSIASVACFALASPNVWRSRLGRAGFRIADSGHVNGMWYVVVDRPPRPYTATESVNEQQRRDASSHHQSGADHPSPLAEPRKPACLGDPREANDNS